MNTQIIKRVISAMLLIAIVGCSPQEEKIEGSIFIVTQGGQSIKLGLVNVRLLDAKQLKTNVEKTTADLALQFAELNGKIDSLSKTNEWLTGKQNLIRLEYDDAKKLADNAAKKMEYDGTAKTSLENQLKRLDEAVWKRDRASVIATWKTWLPIYNTNIFIANSLQDQLKLLRSEQNNVRQTYQETTKSRDRLQETIKEVFFQSLPDSIMSVKSDADGKFSLQLPKEGDYFLAAQFQRRVVDSFEEYYWLVPVRTDGKPTMQVMLSNDNLIKVNPSGTSIVF